MGNQVKDPCRHPILTFDEGGYRVLCRSCDAKWVNSTWSSFPKQPKDLSEFRDGDRHKRDPK